MTYSQLLHAIRAACTVANDTELYIFGSQSILAHLSSIPEELIQSIEIDVCPVQKKENVILIDGVLGEGSLFHQTHGFYIHGVSIETAILPKGWQKRCLKINDNWKTDLSGYCISLRDLAVSKIMAYREKDKEFVEILIAEQLITVADLIEGIELCEIEPKLKERAIFWARRFLI